MGFSRVGRAFGRMGSVSGIVVPTVDETAPVLSSPDIDSLTQTTATAHVTTNEGNGTLYIVITDDTTAPSSAQIIAGHDHEGNAATFADDVAVSSTGVKSFNVTGLTADTEYWFYAVHVDAAENVSNITDFGPFETAAEDIDAGTLVWDTNGATGLRPSFTMTLSEDAVEGDVPKVYFKDSDDVTFTLAITGSALTGTDISNGEVTLTAGEDAAEDGFEAHARLDRDGSLGNLSNEVSFVVDLPETPSLTITTPVTDNTPGGTFTTDDLIEGDTAEIQYDTVDTFDNDPQTLQNEIDATEDAANEFTFATSALADGTWHFRPRVVRPLYGPSAWGESDSITIDTGAGTAGESIGLLLTLTKAA